ncbi:MAG: hypothetical protein QXR93_07600 [Archaeoglobaceae archaeon]
MYKLENLTHEEFIRVALNKTILANNVSARRPLALGIYGASGVGKSSLALYWAEKTLKIINANISDIEHVIDEHIVYRSADAMDVLKHCLECEKKIPIFINMEGREMLDSRASLSQYNKKITQALTLSRAIRPLLLVFCFQRLMDIDIRVREAFNILAKVRSYVRSDGTLIPPEVLYFEVRKRLVSKGKIEEISYIEPVQLYGLNPGVVIAKWRIPDSFELFKEKDREMKMELLVEKAEGERKQEKKETFDQIEKDILRVFKNLQSLGFVIFPIYSLINQLKYDEATLKKALKSLIKKGVLEEIVEKVKGKKLYFYKFKEGKEVVV